MCPVEGNGGTWRDTFAATPAAPVESYKVIGTHPKHGERVIWGTVERSSAEFFLESGVRINGAHYEGLRIDIEAPGG